MARSVVARVGAILVAITSVAALTGLTADPVQAAVVSVAAFSVPGTATPSPVAVFTKCGASALPRARCGRVSVPVDRSRPTGPKIGIAFQLYPANDTRDSAQGTIVSSSGGPGLSNIAAAGLWLSLLQPLLAHRNFLAIDHRGIGQSQAIDCRALQHVLGNQVAAARVCGAQLGATAYRYGSGDVADDVDAVRQALGIDQIDYYGVSYGAVDVRAYAYRHATHLRSAILDSPYNSKDAAFTRTLPTAMARLSVLICDRSPNCSAANPDARQVLDTLIQRLQQHPFTGAGFNADGVRITVRADEKALLSVLYNNYFAAPAFLNQGEIFAAAVALSLGDTQPLLRLIAESPPPTDFGDSAASASVGADYGVFCADSALPWNKSASEAVKEGQYQTALAKLPVGASAPFSIKAWTGFVASQPVLLVPGADACVRWPTPTRPELPFPVDQPFPATVPALLMGGGLDYLDLNSEKSLVPLFPGDPFVTVQNAGHVTTFWNPCAASIAVHFLATLHVGNTSCAADTTGAMSLPGSPSGVLQLQGVGRFPTLVVRAIPASRTQLGDASNPLQRRVAAVAFATVVDAVCRLPRMTGITGRGLRGGLVTVTSKPSGTVIDYRNVHFTDDVSVTGEATLVSSTSLTATVHITGPDGASGTLLIRATLWDPANPLAKITGTLGGHHIAVTTPTR